jgi:hypothetical protein
VGQSNQRPPRCPVSEDGQLHVGPFACLDRSWDFAVEDGHLADLLAELYLPLLAQERSSAHVEYALRLPTEHQPGELHADGQSLLTSTHAARIFDRLIWTINRQVIDSNRDRLLFHAGAVSHADQGVVLLPAPSGSGKSTLTLGLLRRGLAYLTDEAAAVDGDLRVHGFAKPLSIDRGAWDVLADLQPTLPEPVETLMSEQWQIAATHVSRVEPRGCLAAVVLPTYRPGAPTTLRQLTPIEALDLARRSVFGPDPDAPDQPITAAHLRQLARLVEKVPCFSLESCTLDEACEAVLGVLASGSGSHARGGPISHAP